MKHIIRLSGSGGNGQGGNFKNNLMMGPGGPHPTPASDPNYAQQFHNFQQQLYATNTRNPQMGQNNGPPPGAAGPQGKYFSETKTNITCTNKDLNTKTKRITKIF